MSFFDSFRHVGIENDVCLINHYNYYLVYNAIKIGMFLEAPVVLGVHILVPCFPFVRQTHCFSKFLDCLFRFYDVRLRDSESMFIPNFIFVTRD